MSPENIAALMAPKEENAMLMQRMEDPSSLFKYRVSKADIVRPTQPSLLPAGQFGWGGYARWLARKCLMAESLSFYDGSNAAPRNESLRPGHHKEEHLMRRETKSADRSRGAPPRRTPGRRLPAGGRGSPLARRRPGVVAHDLPFA